MRSFAQPFPVDDGPVPRVTEPAPGATADWRVSTRSVRIPPHVAEVLQEHLGFDGSGAWHARMADRAQAPWCLAEVVALSFSSSSKRASS